MATRILVVDDDPDLLEQERMMLGSAGYEVITADGAATAREKLAECRPDVAVVDLMLEEIDSGFTLCHHIKEAYPSLPIIMVSSVAAETGIAFNATTEEERSWIKVEAFLNKPVRTEQLLSEVARLLAASV